MSTETFHRPLGTRTAGFVYVVSYRMREGSQAGWQPAIAFLREAEAARAVTELRQKVQPSFLEWQFQQLPILKFKEVK